MAKIGDVRLYTDQRPVYNLTSSILFFIVLTGESDGLGSYCTIHYTIYHIYINIHTYTTYFTRNNLQKI